jgi:NADH dehydrogenase FAD-containing subunit
LQVARDQAPCVREPCSPQCGLPEAAAGSLEARHVVVQLRKVLHDCEVITARVAAIDHANHTLRVEPVEGQPYDLAYDELVVAFGDEIGAAPVVTEQPGETEFSDE